MRIEEYPVASQILKKQGVPGLHRPVGEQHIDFMRGIKVKCECIDDGFKVAFSIRLDKTISRIKDGEQIHITWAGVVRQALFMLGNRTEENHRKQDVSMPRDRAG
jgi:hypothetical protein